MPTDEVLPRFHVRPSADGDPFHQTVLHSHDFQPAEPAYLKTRSKHPDEYSIALLDAYIPDILFAQVVAKPSISTPSLSLEEIRRQNNGGPPSLPTITLPAQFTIQLYNPESQVVVHQRTSKWTGSYWEFTLPRRSFRQPTGSRLDAQVALNSALPPSDVSTFRWRKDGGVVSKTSLRCTMLSSASSSSDKHAKRKGGSEPDIVVAIMDKLKDVTIYEPNLHRVDVEDKKGLELVLLLTATVIADIYFMTPSTSFNVGVQSAVTPSTSSQGLSPNGEPSSGRRRSSSTTTTTSPIKQSPTQTLLKIPSPPNNAPTIVNNNVLRDNAALQRQQLQEERRRAEEEKRRAREVAAEENKLRKMLEQEAKERRKRQQQVDVETERLKRQYGSDELVWETLRQRQPQPPAIVEPPLQSQLQPPGSQSQRRWSHQPPPRQPLYPVPESQQARPPPPPEPYLSPYAYGRPADPQPPQLPRKKASGLLSIFGSGGSSSSAGLAKKKSSFF
ncbi:hypothetical protein DRE_04337 [Drechslerella stenobrocha 248]|uniref:Uncharacterized protein n=1 Tax=Drechslerella stenobrocha 248 TaxID=1043628 RepID=W7HSX8_9PEZI|nr:hypothetical protein DRE_04337 [Drechslerella stenobrocha 248]